MPRLFCRHCQSLHFFAWANGASFIAITFHTFHPLIGIAKHFLHKVTKNLM
jgi:hypothetical protein